MLPWYHLLQREVKDSLHQSLMSLPRPRNDYEIVIPEDENQHPMEEEAASGYIEDAADVEAKQAAEKEAESKIVKEHSLSVTSVCSFAPFVLYASICVQTLNWRAFQPIPFQFNPDITCH